MGACKTDVTNVAQSHSRLLLRYLTQNPRGVSSAPKAPSPDVGEWALERGYQSYPLCSHCHGYTRTDPSRAMAPNVARLSCKLACEVEEDLGY